MSNKAKGSKGAPKKGDAVKVIEGEHSGVAGKLVHIRKATSQAHVQPENGAPVVVVGVDQIAAA